jgi:hypothetical protein
VQKSDRYDVAIVCESVQVSKTKRVYVVLDERLLPALGGCEGVSGCLSGREDRLSIVDRRSEAGERECGRLR